MPKGVPKIGSKLEDLTNVETAETIGTISQTRLDPQSDPISMFDVAGSAVSVEEELPPPPWELDPDKERDDTDARLFVEVPEEWVLRWINPRLLDQSGWRWWEPVMASDPRVVVKVTQMVSPEGNIRRGGRSGDLLAWMWRHWYESNQKNKAAKNAKRTQSAVDRFNQTVEAFRTGFGKLIGPYGRAQHPQRTIGDGRTMRESDK